MKVVYVAGPYRAPDAWRVEQNIRAAEEVAFEVAKLGHSYICPHTNARYFDGTLTAQFWIDMTMQLMLRCDGVVLAPGWEDSAGSLGELMGKVGLKTGQKSIPRVMGACIDLLRPLPRPVRLRVLDGIRTFVVSDTNLVDHGPEDEDPE
jgi:hypothetical protein